MDFLSTTKYLMTLTCEIHSYKLKCIVLLGSLKTLKFHSAIGIVLSVLRTNELQRVFCRRTVAIQCLFSFVSSTKTTHRYNAFALINDEIVHDLDHLYELQNTYHTEFKSILFSRPSKPMHPKTRMLTIRTDVRFCFVT